MYNLFDNVTTTHRSKTSSSSRPVRCENKFVINLCQEIMLVLMDEQQTIFKLIIHLIYLSKNNVKIIILNKVYAATLSVLQHDIT
jgi:hypothetical protein